MRISTIRHGKASYANVAPIQDWNAVDLVPESIPDLQRQAELFVQSIWDESVTIWSSPIPRAIQTAQIFETELLAQGKSIRKKNIFHSLEEVRGFKWIYLSSLANWGTVDVDGVSIQVNPAFTNPKQLSVSEYFRNSEWKNLSQEAKVSLGAFAPIAENMEAYASIVSRMLRILERLKGIQEKPHHLLMFTHQCCTDFLIEAVNDYSQWWIDPGASVTLEVRDTGIHIQDSPFGVGQATQDIIETTKQRMQSASAV